MKVRNKTVSVAMATYNGERFLREQLDSLINQTHVPDEIIVCDDRSNDSTLSILEEYHQKCGLIYYVNDANLGVSNNFFKAISLCSSDYVIICDQDDIWLPQKIEVTLNKMLNLDNGQPVVVSSLCNHIDAQGNILQMLPDKKDTVGYRYTLIGIGTSQGCSLMLNRSIINEVLYLHDTVPELNNTLYDVIICFTASLIGVKYNLGQRLMLYRHHDSNVVAKMQSGNTSLKKRIQSRWSIPGLMPDERYNTLSVLYKYYGKLIKDNDESVFLSKIITIQYLPLPSKVKTILSLKEFSFMKRVIMAVKTVFTSIEKKI